MKTFGIIHKAIQPLVLWCPCVVSEEAWGASPLLFWTEQPWSSSSWGPETPLPAPPAVRLQPLGSAREELFPLPHDRLSEI